MKLYLDNCCFNRPYDDQSQIRIRLESEAKLKIQEEIRAGARKLVWSYILDYENGKNPFMERRERIAIWRNYAREYIEENRNILELAQMIHGHGIRKLDSLHLACAIHSKAEYFLTTDDGILKKSALITDIRINDPIGFIKEVVT